MSGFRLALIALVSLAAAPALAAPCTTRGTADTPIVFPKNEPGDVAFARSMVPVILPEMTDALPRSPGCTRAVVHTAFGDYAIGGENGDAVPRIAMRTDAKAGPVVYLAASPEAPGVFALVVYARGSLAVVRRFYAAIPSDARLAADVPAVLAEDGGAMAYEPRQKMVTYGFALVGGVPPPVESGPRGDGGSVTAGPQIMILSSGDPRLVNVPDDMRHRPSGFACPSHFEGLAVLLKTIDPQANYLACSYRAGTELRFNPDDPIRYQIMLLRAAHGDTPRRIFDQMVAEGRAALRITGDHPLPLATGAAPAPAFAAFWDTRGDGVQGVWVGKAGRWIVAVRAQYPPGAANDAEAGKVARVLFAEVARQMR